MKDQISQARPARVAREPKPVTEPMKVTDALGMLSAKVTERWRNNPAMKDCCRDIEPSEIQFFDIDNNGTPDLVVMTCNVCGCKHRVVAAAGKKAMGS